MTQIWLDVVREKLGRTSMALFVIVAIMEDGDGDGGGHPPFGRFLLCFGVEDWDGDGDGFGGSGGLDEGGIIWCIIFE